MKERAIAWVKKHPILTTLFSVVLLFIIASPFMPKENSNELSDNLQTQNLEIGYLSLVENDGTCEIGTTPIALWKNP